MAEIIDVDLPFLLESDVLTHACAVLYFNKERHSGIFDDWSLPLVRKIEHLYVERPVGILISSEEWRRNCSRFKRASGKLLYALINLSDPHGQHLELMREPEDIQWNHHVCQRVADTLWCFRVLLPNEDDMFNSKLFLDIKKLAQRSVHHAEHESTQSGAACFPASKPASTIWSVFDQMWPQFYDGIKDKIACD